MDTKFVLALEPRGLKQEGSSFGIRLSIYVLKVASKRVKHVFRNKLELSLFKFNAAFILVLLTTKLSSPDYFFPIKCLPQLKVFFHSNIVFIRVLCKSCSLLTHAWTLIRDLEQLSLLKEKQVLQS